MATKSQKSSNKSTSKSTKSTSTTSRSPAQRRRRQSQPVQEPVAARALQSVLLVVGVLLLFSVFFGQRFGPAMVGVLVFGSAFPPVRRYVDKWLVGKAKGEDAERAAMLRMGAGLGIVLLGLLGVFPF